MPTGIAEPASIFDSSGSLGNLSSQLIGVGSGDGSLDSSGNSDSSEVNSTSGDSNGDDTNATDQSDESTLAPSDPRLAWTPFQLPEDISFAEAPLPAQSALDNLFSLTPTGTDSTLTTTVTESVPKVTATDEALGVGSRTESTKSTVTLIQDYISENEWTITQTVRNEYKSDEASKGDDESDTGIQRNSWTELTVTVVNGQHSIISYSAFDSFSYSVATEWDDSKPEDEESDGGDTTSESDSSDTDEDELLDKDTGDFEGSFSAATSFSVTFEQYFVTLTDGTVNMVFTLGFGNQATFESSVEGGYEQEDSEGETVEFAEKSDDGLGGDEDENDTFSPTYIYVNPDHEQDDDDFGSIGDLGEGLGALDAPITDGGNGHSLSASADFSLSQSFGMGSSFSLGAMVPQGGTIDDVPDSDFFGSLSSTIDTSSSGSIGSRLDVSVQESGDGGEKAYLSVSLNGSRGGGSNFAFSYNDEYGENPAGRADFQSSTQTTPSTREPKQLGLGFGFSTQDHGNGGHVIKAYKETVLESQFTGGTTRRTLIEQVISAGSGNSDMGFGFGQNEQTGEYELNIQVSFGGSGGITEGTILNELTTRSDDTGHGWEKYRSVIATAAIFNSTGNFTIGVGADIDLDITAEFILTQSSVSVIDGTVKTLWQDAATGSVTRTFGRDLMAEGVVFGGNLDDGFEGEAFQEVLLTSDETTSEPERTTDELSQSLDRLQFALDVAGMVPGIGEAADLLNAGIHLARGNMGDAALGLAAAVPLLGNAVTAGKMASRGGKVIGRNVGKFENAADGIKTTWKNCTDGVNCFIAGTQVVVARADDHEQLAEVASGQAVPGALEVVDEKSLDAYYAAGALALGVGLSFKPRGKSPSKTNRRRRFWI